MGGCNDSPQDYHKDRHNNINNNISNSKINKKSCGAGAAIAAPPQSIPKECMDIVNDFNNGKIGKNEAKHLIEEWWYREINKVIELNPNLNKYKLVDDGSEEYKKAKEIEVIATSIYSSFNEKSENYYF